MVDVVHSAAKGTSSIFDVVTHSADTISKLIGTASLAVDSLDAKTRAMHKRILIDTKVSMLHAEDNAIIEAANRRTDLMEETHRKNFAGEPFDRAQTFRNNLEEITKALAS